MRRRPRSGVGPGRVWPVMSSVCQAWDWNARKMATHWSVAGNRRSSPPSCHTPSSPLMAGIVALVHVDVVDAVARLEMEHLVGLPGSGPQRSPKA